MRNAYEEYLEWGQPAGRQRVVCGTGYSCYLH